MMGSTAATTLGMATTGAASSAPGDAPASESGAGFLAALSAALPAATSAAAGTSKAASVAAEGENGGDPADELAAAIAAMLQANVAPAEELAASEATDEAPDMTSLPATSAARAWFAGLRPAAPAVEGGEATAESDPAESFLRHLTGGNPEAIGEALAPSRAEVTLPVKGDLRQMLQMMSQAAGAPTDVTPPTTKQPTGEIVPLAAASGAAIAQAVEAAVAAASTVQPGASAPSSMLAAAATNFGSPLPQPPPTTAPPHTLHAEVGTPRWAEELGSRMTMMTLRGQHEGSLSLTPEHLGPVEVRISVSQNTAHVWFGAQHADARAALAEALPRLREMFGDAGMTLGHADVSQQAPRQGSREGALARVGGMQVDGADVVDAANPPAVRVALGLVDTYV